LLIGITRKARKEKNMVCSIGGKVIEDSLINDIAWINAEEKKH
jgi:hypothetical protein